ncbi:HAD family hydrolase [Desulfovibrio oxyclinae]|jgi:phosphoglycolate phosphatase|uniref:HAD family hydrolase n=1 Tax=Desulfovibrio oxyclinae TaxID=63560 RepID=UPI00037D3FC5|nr:HAD family hydrolase [Desulfovibrio oxyclinae]
MIPSELATAFEAVIFDFDGTLAELTLDFTLMKTKIAALGECFLPHRPEPDGTPALEWMETLTAHVERECDRDTALEFNCRCRLAITAMELDAARDGNLFEFTRPLLLGLREHGIATGIITRNTGSAVRTVFPDVNEHTGVLLAREDAPRIKPHPAHLLQALERLGVAPAHALMVGDHPLDMKTGRAAGTATAGVMSGRCDADDLKNAGADLVFEDASRLLAPGALTAVRN